MGKNRGGRCAPSGPGKEPEMLKKNQKKAKKGSKKGVKNFPVRKIFFPNWGIKFS